jgi:ABC-2 type transport system permease protein
MTATADSPTAETGTRWAPRPVEGLAGELGAVIAMIKHWLAISARDRKFVITATLIPINYLFLFLITVINGNQAPTALVMADHGPYAQAFVRTLRGTDTFNFHTLNAGLANRIFQQGRVVAMVTIPASFDREVASSRTAPISLRINNVENDFVDDVEHGADLAIQRFATHTAPGGARVVTREVDEHPHQVKYIPYVLISIVVVALMIGGLFYGGVNTAREYELRSIIDLMLAPRSRTSLLVGMTLGTFLVAAPGALLILVLVLLAFGISAASWPEVALAWALVLVLYSAAGVLLGTALRQRNGLSGLAILLAIPLLSLSGAFYPVSWSSPVIQAIAHISPTYYANALFEHAFFAVHTTPTSLGLDYLVVALFLVAAVTGSAMLMRYREEPA